MKLNDVLDERIIDMHVQAENKDEALTCLLYTSDAADD